MNSFLVVVAVFSRGGLLVLVVCGLVDGNGGLDVDGGLGLEPLLLAPLVVTERTRRLIEETRFISRISYRLMIQI